MPDANAEDNHSNGPHKAHLIVNTTNATGGIVHEIDGGTAKGPTYIANDMNLLPGDLTTNPYWDPEIGGQYLPGFSAKIHLFFYLPLPILYRASLTRPDFLRILCALCVFVAKTWLLCSGRRLQKYLRVHPIAQAQEGRVYKC